MTNINSIYAIKTKRASHCQNLKYVSRNDYISQRQYCHDGQLFWRHVLLPYINVEIRDAPGLALKKQ